MMRFMLAGQDDVVRGETYADVFRELKARWRLDSPADTLDGHLERLARHLERLGLGRIDLAAAGPPGKDLEGRCRSFVTQAEELGLLVRLCSKAERDAGEKGDDHV